MAQNQKKQKNTDSIFSFSGKRFLNGSYSAMMIVFAISIVIILNLVVSKLPSKYTEIDVSGVKMYTVGKETKKLLKKLDTDVEIYYLVNNTKKKTYAEVTKLVKQYADASSHIKVIQRDPELYPSFGSQYNATSTTLLVVKSDKRYKLVDLNDIYTISNYEEVYNYGETAQYDFNGENLIANAVNYVTTDKLPKMYVLQGNGEVALDDTIKGLITDANISVEDLSLLKQETVPTDCDCLLIVAPDNDLNEKEAKAIISYLKDGGNAIICADYKVDKKMPNFLSVLEAYGVTIADGVVHEGSSENTYNNTATYIFPELQSLDFTSDLVSGKAQVFMPATQAITTLKDKADTINVESLLTTSSSAYLKSGDDLTSGKSEKSKGDPEGPFDVAVAITDNNISEEEAEESGNTQVAKTKLVVFGTSNIVDASIYSSVTPYDAALFSNAVDWMCKTQNSISISAKKLTSEQITITDAHVNRWMMVYVIVIPMVILVTGIVVVIRRNRK